MSTPKQSLQRLITFSVETRDRTLRLTELVAQGQGDSDEARTLAQQINPPAFKQSSRRAKSGAA